MRLKINGAACEIADDASIAGMLAARNLPGETVIILLNDEVITREKWESLKLRSEDSVEIVRLIGGG